MMATTITITAESGIKSSYGNGDTFTVDEAEFWYSGVMYNSKGSPAAAAAKSFIQLRKSDKGAGEIKNNTELALKSITIATQNDKDFTLSAGTEADALDAVAKPDGTTGTYQFVDKNGNDASCDVTIYTFDVEGNAYFDILNGANASYFAYIAIELAGGDVPPVTPTMSYYVAGSMTNWGPMAAYKLAANPAVEGEYMGEFTFAANDEFKVGYSDGTTIESTNYFPTGLDNNYVITEAGDYTVYFRPDCQGGEDWHYGCIYAEYHEPATPLSLTEFIAAAPTTEVTLKPLTVIFASGKNTYVIDEEGIALVIFDANKTYYDGTLTAGKVLTGQKATYTLYKNQSEIIPTNTAVASDGVAPVPTELDAAPTDEHINHFVSFKNVEATLNNKNYYIFSNVQLYGATGSLKPTEEGNYDVEGLYIVYNGTQPELIVTAIAQASATAINNTADEIKAFKTIENGQLVIIKNGVRYDATGAVIR
jgi:hypothetical protein